MDFSLWDLKEEFSIHEAACLWFEVEPIRGYTDVKEDKQIKISTINNVLEEAAKNEKIEATTPTGPDAWMTQPFTPKYSRESLKRFAESTKQKPLFLFPEERKKEPRPAAKSKEKARQDPLYKEVENLRYRMKNKIGDGLKKMISELLGYGYQNQLIQFKDTKPKTFTISLPDNFLGNLIENILEKELQETIDSEMEAAKANNYIRISENKKSKSLEFIITI